MIDNLPVRFLWVHISIIKKKSTKKIRTHKKKIEKKPETATLTEKPKSKPKKNTKNSTVKKILNVSSHETKKSGKLFTENEWIAVNEEDTDWYVGKVKNIKEVGGKKLVTIESIMIRSSMKKSKHFQLEHNQNSEKQIFFDDIVCKISCRVILLSDFQKVFANICESTTIRNS